MADFSAYPVAVLEKVLMVAQGDLAYAEQDPMRAALYAPDIRTQILELVAAIAWQRHREAYPPITRKIKRSFP